MIKLLSAQMLDQDVMINNIEASERSQSRRRTGEPKSVGRISFTTLI